MHVTVGQTGSSPVFEVRPEGRTGKPRELHINLLLPFYFFQVDHPDPSANQSQGKVPSSSPKKVRERFQGDKFGTSDSVDEDESSGLKLKTNLFLGQETEKTIATLSSRDSHRMCCCDQLGNPSYHPCRASRIQIATANSVPGQIMYCLPCPPCPPVIATLSYYGSANLHVYRNMTRDQNSGSSTRFT